MKLAVVAVALLLTAGLVTAHKAEDEKDQIRIENMKAVNEMQ